MAARPTASSSGGVRSAKGITTPGQSASSTRTVHGFKRSPTDVGIHSAIHASDMVTRHANVFLVKTGPAIGAIFVAAMVTLSATVRRSNGSTAERHMPLNTNRPMAMATRQQPAHGHVNNRPMAKAKFCEHRR